MPKLNYNPVVLIVMDGWGICEPSDTNGIYMCKSPFIDQLYNTYPSMLLEASGLNVGLPWGEVGNSEVGHVNIGSGVLFYQSLPRIDKSIDDGSLFNNEALLKARDAVNKNSSKLHLMGLLGTGGVHAHERHLAALLEFCQKNNLTDVYLHLFLDGRDSSKDSAKKFLKNLDKIIKKSKVGKIASLHGRFYAMDRNNNWDRIQKSYEVMVEGKCDKPAKDPVKAIDASYKKEIYDEEFVPVVLLDGSKPVALIEPKDAVVFYNFRADRARQLTRVFVKKSFDKFKRKFLENLTFVTFTEYEKGLPVEIMFPPMIIENSLARIFSDSGLKQLHIAETEKYAHVTFFLNGMQEKKYKGEERILIPSPAVPTYDLQPEMSADLVTDEIIKALKADKFDFYAINFANPDMVGHTGSIEATIKACETVDNCLSRIVPEIVKKGGICFITGDHGNAEELINLQTQKVDKEHSIYPVPFMICANKFVGKQVFKIEERDLSLLTPAGLLSDIAPTILENVGLPIPDEMTGGCLLK